MTSPVNQNARLELLTSDVYRVNPMDRDSGGRGDGGQFERSMKKKDEGEDSTGAEPKATPREVSALEDGVTLSEPAKAALGGGQASVTRPEAMRPPADEPAPAASAASEPPPHPTATPPGTRINLIA